MMEYRVKGPGGRLMAGVIVIFSALFLMNAFSFAADSAEEADFVFAKKAFNDGFYDLAEERLAAFLRAYPETPRLYEAHFLRGVSFYSRNNFSKALYEFEIILSSPAAGNFTDGAIYWIGEIYLKTGDYKKALQSYQKVLDDFKSSRYTPFALYSKAWSYYKLGLYDKAAGYFKGVASHYPMEKIAIESQFRAGECEYLLNRHENALEEFKKFIERFPLSEKTPDAYYLAGESAFYLGEYKEAISSFSRAVEISPRAKWIPFATYRMARSYLKTGDYAESIKMFRKCLDNYDNELIKSGSLLGLVQSYEKEGLLDDAKKACDEIIESSAGMEAVSEAYYRKIRILYGESRYDEAEKVALEAIGKFSESDYLDNYHYELGWIYSMQGKDENAVREFRWVENESEDINLSSSALCKIGDIYREKGDHKKAIESYDSVLDKYSDSFWADHAEYQLGMIFAETGRLDQATLAFQSILVNFPNSNLREKSMLQLGFAYFKRNDFEHAALEFEKLIKEFPGGETAPEARLYLGNSLYNMAKYGEAIPNFKEIIRSRSASEPAKEMAQYQLGWSNFRMQKTQEAADEFALFLKKYPQSEMVNDVLYWFGEYYRSRAQYSKAREYFKEILDNFSSDDMIARAMFALALTSLDEGKAGDAAGQLEELTAKFPGTDLARASYRRIAAIKKDEKDFDAVIDYLKKALTAENNEANAQIQYEIAEIFEEKGELVRAVEEYLKVPYIYSKGRFWALRAQLKCAKLFERLDRINEAVKLYEKLVLLDVEESKFAKERLEWLKWREAK